MKDKITTLIIGATLGVGGSFGVGEIQSNTLEGELERIKTVDGRYLQILKDGTVADAKNLMLFDTKRLPPNTFVNVYDGPKGKGYQIVTEFSDRIEYYGYGPAAKDYTYTEIKNTLTASST